MAEITVRQLARQVGIPVGSLLVQLAESGLSHTDANDLVHENERKQLLAHLRRVQDRVQGNASGAGDGASKKRALRRQSASEPGVTDPGSERAPVTIAVRKRRALRSPMDAPPTEQIAPEPPVPDKAPPAVFASTNELEAVRRVLLEEAKQRNAVVDATIRADIEAREKAELLKPKLPPKPQLPPEPRRQSTVPRASASDSTSVADRSAHLAVSGIAAPGTEVPAHNAAEGAAESAPEGGAAKDGAAEDAVEAAAESGAAGNAGRVTPPEAAPVLARTGTPTDAGSVLGTQNGSAGSLGKNTATRKRQRQQQRAERRSSLQSERRERATGRERKEERVAGGAGAQSRTRPTKSRTVDVGRTARPGFRWLTRATTPSAALRPGTLTGSYPEREDMRDSWLERTAASAAGLLRQHIGGGRPRYQHFIDLVHTAAEGMDELDDAQLAGLVPDLRRRLYSEGFVEELVSRSFAIIREMATRRLGMRHYDVQLYGGWIMLNGMIAEMETGEGKTLTATLTAATVALAGIPVHVVTVNDFLVQRDAAWMQPLYRALGLKIGTITEDMDPEQRRKAYACDITYCTNKQLVFDYLKDRLILGADSRRLHMQLETLHSEVPRTGRLLLRGLCFAIVDEADSVLVDEARTPLVISKAGDTAQQEKTYRDAIRIARQLRGGRDFEVQTRDRRVELSDAGKKRAALLTRELKGVWTGVRRRESLIRQALSAIHLFQADRHYLINDGKVQIVDEYTGRVMADRSWEGGLHQMIQAKEGVEISGQQETLARISYQRFFRRYLRVAGMTGTAHEVARELWSVYRLNVVSVPTNRPVVRTRLPDSVYVDDEHKWQAAVHDIRVLHRHHQPVLVGTRSVGASEHLSELLHAAGLQHVVLNARQDQHEAEVVAMAGQAGRITVATNMAGRGTDIRLAPGVAADGGLHVLATERHESGRVDRQLFGRGARQGDPGSYRCVVSLEDELIQDFWPSSVLRMARAMSRGGRLPHWLGSALVALAQRAAENNHGRMRRDLLRLDDNLGDMLAFSGRGE